MRTRTKVVLIAVPVVVGAAAGITVAVVVRRIRRRVIPKDIRKRVEEILVLKGEDFVPDGLGTSLYQRKLTSLTDKQLLGVYALVKVGELMRLHGVDMHVPTRYEVKAAREQFRLLTSSNQGRQELLDQLGALGAEAVQEVMRDGLLVLEA